MCPGIGEGGRPLECSANTVNLGGVKDDVVVDSRYLLSTRSPEIGKRWKMYAAV